MVWVKRKLCQSKDKRRERPERQQREHDPTTGDFVVAWQQRVSNPINGAGTNVSNLLARQFQADGSPIEANSVVTVATATFDTVNWLNAPYTLAAYPSGGMGVNDAIGIAALPGGGGAFDVTWTNYDETLIPSSSTPSGWQGIIHQDIYASSVDSSGVLMQSLAVTTDGKSSGSSAAVDGNIRRLRTSERHSRCTFQRQCERPGCQRQHRLWLQWHRYAHR